MQKNRLQTASNRAPPTAGVATSVRRCDAAAARAICFFTDRELRLSSWKVSPATGNRASRGPRLRGAPAKSSVAYGALAESCKPPRRRSALLHKKPPSGAASPPRDRAVRDRRAARGSGVCGAFPSATRPQQRDEHARMTTVCAAVRRSRPPSGGMSHPHGTLCGARAQANTFDAPRH